MPPWGRPPGGRGADVGRYLQEVEDVYRFQEVDSDDEKNGVMSDPAHQRVSISKQYFNPDELYFNDMDIRAWERRAQELDALAYGEDYGYLEDEGYYDDAGDVTMSAAEYEELLFQRVLDKIRLARATGESDVQITPEELDAYQARLLGRPRVPAARPQVPRARPVSAPVLNGNVSTAGVTTSGNAAASGSSSTRSKKSQRRTSIFGSRPKKEKSRSRTRATSNASNTTSQQPPPVFIVPGPNGQPVYAPINAYQGRMPRDHPVRPSGSPSRQSSRSASISSDRVPVSGGNNTGDLGRGLRQAQTPPRVSPPRDVPGAFPSGSPQRSRDPTPPHSGRPASSSSRQSTQDSIDSQLADGTARRSSVQQTARLVPFPVTEYKHYTAEPYHYQVAGQVATSQPSSSQPQFARRVVSGPAGSNYMTMPRRVPVPDQRAAAPMLSAQGSHSDPALVQRASGSRAEVSDEEDGQGAILVDVVPQADDKSYKVQTVKTSTKEGSSGGSNKDSERRRRSGRSRRKY